MQRISIDTCIIAAGFTQKASVAEPIFKCFTLASCMHGLFGQPHARKQFQKFDVNMMG